MNKQRKVLITITYNEMGIIIDTKAEEVAQTKLQPACNQLATDTISRHAAISAIDNCGCDGEDSCGEPWIYKENAVETIEMVEPLPPAQPGHLNDDDFETIRIHLSAVKEQLCNQHRFNEAKDYQRLIDRFMQFASAQPESDSGRWEKLQPVFLEIAEEYKKSCEISYINKPLAYALHEVWKKHDRRETNRNETKTGQKDQ